MLHYPCAGDRNFGSQTIGIISVERDYFAEFETVLPPESFFQFGTRTDSVRKADVDQITLDGNPEQTLGGLTRNMEGGGDLLLSLSCDVIEPSDSGGLVEFIGFFAGGHQLRLLTFALVKGKCSSAGK